MNEKLIITAALTGAGTPRSAAPSVPITAQEIARDAAAAVKAGAAIIHIHVRDDDERGTMDTGKFTEAFEAVKGELAAQNLDAIINLTTSGGVSGWDERMAHLKVLRPEMCSFDAGSMNWGNSMIFDNHPEFLRQLALLTLEMDIKPEIEIFDASMIGNALYYIKNGMLREPCHFQFVLGVPGGLGGNIDCLAFLLSKLPKGATWSITGIGKAHLPMMLAGLAAGAHGLRVGLEDNVFFSDGIPATNAQLVERAAGLARLAERGIASAQEAREILGIKRTSFAC
jgi:uncharacterized protein (DUF849 family)